jgi:transcriptional regulator with XRE-family HTH domain
MDPRDLRQAFAANLRRLRHAKGISQEDLAYEADVNRTYLSKLEKGVSYPGLEVSIRRLPQFAAWTLDFGLAIVERVLAVVRF